MSVGSKQSVAKSGQFIFLIFYFLLVLLEFVVKFSDLFTGSLEIFALGANGIDLGNDSVEQNYRIIYTLQITLSIKG